MKREILSKWQSTPNEDCSPAKDNPGMTRTEGPGEHYISGWREFVKLEMNNMKAEIIRTMGNSMCELRDVIHTTIEEALGQKEGHLSTSMFDKFSCGPRDQAEIESPPPVGGRHSAGAKQGKPITPQVEEKVSPWVNTPTIIEILTSSSGCSPREVTARPVRKTLFVEKVDKASNARLPPPPPKHTLRNGDGYKDVVGRFRLLTDLTSADRDILVYLFSPNDYEEDRDGVIASTFRTINRQGLACLKPECWIDSDVINVASDFLQAKAKHTWFFPTYYAQYAFSALDNDRWSHLQADMEKLCRLESRCRGQLLEMCDRIFIPVNDSRMEHWYLVVVRMDNREVEVWDSLVNSIDIKHRRYQVQVILTSLDVVFKFEKEFLRDETFEFDCLPVNFPPQAPQQQNGYDCGLFVIRNMEYHGSEWHSPTSYNSMDERINLSLDLFTNPLNKARHNVMAIIERHVKTLSADKLRRCMATCTPVQGEMPHPVAKKPKLGDFRLQSRKKNRGHTQKEQIVCWKPTTDDVFLESGQGKKRFIRRKRDR